MIRITDFVSNHVQLRLCLDLRLGVHPGQRVDVIVHGGFDVVDHLHGRFLIRRREILLRVDLAESLAEGPISRLHTALPAGALLGLAAQLASVEVELLLVHCFGQDIARHSVDELPAQVGLDGVEVG